ncbi:MAG: topoisomerase DNA-binding C4 zinc finger domain-containing protein [Eubacterium sp.]|nr:topoisomerase DNA-binding C4 zinc finger domain-containing protein [Eubacterium sp.]
MERINMAVSKSNLIYALKHGKAVHISEVESGLKCNCTCPACNEPLIARKGQKTMHHFAHKAKSECEYGYQSSLHLAAKDILSEYKTIVLPEVAINFYNHGGSYKFVKISDAKEITFDRIVLEKKQGDIIPDVIGYVGNKKIYIEIFVTHAIDENKLKRIKSENISTIEIDLSDIDRNISKEELTEMLLKDNPAKKWIYNKLENEWYNRFIKHSIKLMINGSRVYHCPKSKKKWKGPPYAVITLDCQECEYCTDINYDYVRENNNYILCSGKERIAEIEDFDIPLEKRIEITNAQLERDAASKISQFICPYCDGNLVIRESQYGEFLGCSNYPRCQFSASINPETGEFKTRY